MFEDLIKALSGLGITGTPSETPEEIQRLIPDQVTAQDVARWLASDSAANQVDALRALHVLLSNERGITACSDDKEEEEEERKALEKIAEYVGEAILPVFNHEPSDEDKTDYNNINTKGQLGLSILDKLTRKHRVRLSSRTLISIAAFTSSDDAWTTAASAKLSQKLLEDHFQSQEEQRAKFIAEDVLTDLLRPLFSKSRPATVTASGRKAEFVEPSRYDNASTEAEARKPWKYGRRYAVTVFEWAVLHSDEHILQKSWHFFTPVLLTLLDEPQTALKVRALGMFRAFWAQCPADLMRQTGLAQVFEDAVFPAVLYLPSLTPADESVAILNAAYLALMALAGVDPGVTTDEPQSSPAFTGAQQALLDKMVREGILVGYHHASEHVRLVELLCEKLRCIVNGMGILSVKHLKNLIAMVSEIMTEPFGTQYPPALLSAIRLLQTILRTCWPRIPHYCNEIIKAMIVCWLNVEEEDSFPHGGPSAAELETELTKTADMLTAVMKAADIDMQERVSPLVKTEPSLGKLFKASLQL